MTPDPVIKCVTLKNDIQAKLLQASQHLSSQERTHQRQKNLNAAASPLAQWWQRLLNRQPVAGGNG